MLHGRAPTLPQEQFESATRGDRGVTYRVFELDYCLVEQLRGMVMDDRTWEKYGALGVVWFAVFGLVGGLLPGRSASRTDSAGEIANHFADNDTAIQVGAFLTILGLIGLIWWFGSLWRAMDRAEDGSPRLAIIALIGFLISATMAVSGFAINAGIAAGIDQIGEGSAFYLHLSSILFAASPIGDVIMVTAISGLIWRTGFLPKWVAQTGVVVVVTALLASVGVASDAEFFELFASIGFFVWLLWILTVGVLLYQKAPADA